MKKTQKTPPWRGDLIKNLNPQQIEGVVNTEGPVLILAGAGSGKTRVLTHRIAYLIREKKVVPTNILAITFTNKAANEMKTRVEKIVGKNISYAMWILTFHSMCVRILRTHIENLGFKRNFVIYDDGDSLRLIKHCMSDLDIDTKQYNPRAISSKISWLKNELIDPKEFSSNATEHFEEIVSRVFKLYQFKLFQNNALDFDDLLIFTVRLFERFPDVLRLFQDQFHYIMVDEYQDTNKAQYEIVRMLADLKKNIFTVGDDDQSVYTWRGADIRNILEFELDYPDAKIIKLEQNYRSTKNILEAANHVVRNNSWRKTKSLWTENEEGNKIIKHQAASEHDEAAFIASEIHRLINEEGRSLNELVIFYRVNAQSRVLEEIFIRYGIPYKIVGGLKFYDRAEVKDILAYLRLIVNPSDSVSLKRVINKPRRGIGKTTVQKMEKYTDDQLKESSGLFTLWNSVEQCEKISDLSPRVRKEISNFRNIIERLQSEQQKLNLQELVYLAMELSGLVDELKSEHTVEAEGKLENLEEFFNSVKEFAEDHDEATLEQLLESVSLIADIDKLKEDESSATMMTVHNAKGLEYPIVFLSGMEDGMFPHIRSLYESKQLEEERRLCYVGITRAKEQLYLTHATTRNLYGGSSYQLQSRFLNEIPDHLIE